MVKLSQKKDHLVIGVTGGIGVGKTAVCSLFAQRGRTIISADKIARELTDNDPSIKQQLRVTFGEAICDRNGVLDRAKLARAVFASSHQRRKLNAIVHPAVFRVIDEQIGSLTANQRRPYVLVEAALIYETGMEKQLDYVIVVDAADGTRIQRVMQRDRISREQVISRIQSQMPTGRKRAQADFVIENNSTPSALRSKVAFLDSLLAKLSR